jgi:hypothetical protein
MSTIFRIEKNKNFTIMSNKHLKDRRLSYKSKGLLSVILSLPPEWDFTITGLAVIAADGKDSVRTAINELEKNGYLVRSQLRDENGRMTVNEYLVYEDPAQNPAYHSEEHTEDNSEIPEKNGSFLSPSTDNPPKEKPSAENPTTVSSKKSNKKIFNTHKENHSITRARARKKDGANERRNVQNANNANNSVHSSAEWQYYSDLISRNVDIEGQNPLIRDEVEEMVSIMTDVVCSKSATIRVNREDVPQSRVKDKFLHLTDANISFVLDAMKKRSGLISNVRSYLITTLYNSANTMSNFYSNLAHNDIRGGLI